MFLGELAGDGGGVGADLILTRAATERHEHVEAAAAGGLGERFEAVILQAIAQQQPGAGRGFESVGGVGSNAIQSGRSR